MKKTVAKHKWVIALSLIASLIALLVGGYAGWQKSRPQPATSGVPSATLAQIELPDTEKNLRNGKEWLGKVVVVNHWATWCPPCLEEIPMLINFQEQMRDADIQIIGIAHDLLDATRIFGDEIGINYPSLVAIVGGDELMRQQGNASGGLPFTAFFDRNGNLANTWLGKISGKELKQMIAPLL